MERQMLGKISVVTGGGSGIGEALAKRYSKEGAAVAILDINLEEAQRVAAEIAATGQKALAIETDVTSKESVFKASERTLREFGRIDVWVNAAGVSHIVPFLDCTEELWNQTIDINLKGSFFACQAAVSAMLKQEEGGAIVNFSSLSGKKATSQYAAYCASKYGILGLSQSIALEFAKNKIRVNSICPGIVETPMWDKQKIDYGKKRGIAPEEVMDYFRGTIPMGELCSMDSVTDTAVFLSSSASAYLTGQSIVLAGGAYME